MERVPPANESRRLVRHPLRVLRVSAVNTTSTAATPRARRDGAQRSQGRLDEAAPVAASGRLAQCGSGQGSTYLRTAVIRYTSRAVGLKRQPRRDFHVLREGFNPHAPSHANVFRHIAVLPEVAPVAGNGRLVLNLSSIFPTSLRDPQRSTHR